MSPSPEFIILASTLFDKLPHTGSINDTLLLQLQTIFGSMLLSALQLIDRREVVRTTLPGGREIYQVTSSTGNPYTLYLPTWRRSVPSSETFRIPSPPLAQNSLLANSDSPEPPDDSKPPGEASNRDFAVRVAVQAKFLETLYCPCAGFAYNTLSGERNVFCKHLLAVVLAERLGREVESDVGLLGVAGLLGLDSMG